MLSLERIARGIEERNPREILIGVNAELHKHNRKTIRTLDDITSKTTLYSLSKVLDFREQNVNDMRKRLVELGALPENIGRYSLGEQKHIFKTIVERLENSTGGKPLTQYLHRTLKSEVLEENRRGFARSDEFKAYLRSKGVSMLDDIDRSHAIQPLAKALGFTQNSSYGMRNRLIELGTFSVDLREYHQKDRERIAMRELYKRDNGGKNSNYFNKELHPLILESNRKELVRTEVFKAWLDEQGIHTLDDITGEKTPQLDRTLGIWKGKAAQFKRKMIELEVFSTDISQYKRSEQEHIAQTLIDHANGNNWASGYFDKRYVNEQTRARNAQLVLELNVTKLFLEKHGACQLHPESLPPIVKKFYKKLGLMQPPRNHALYSAPRTI